MTDILKKIAATKSIEVAQLKASITKDALAAKASQNDNPRGFAKALRLPKANKPVGLIAEIKKASPSKGVIRHDFHPAQLAKAYENGGADCLSVLTDQTYFQGGLDDLVMARTHVNLPILRKDFLIDPIQVIEARVFGADAILIIMAMIDDEMAKTIHDEALNWGMDILVEIHDHEELQRALKLFVPNENLLLGINNRNLKTFELSLEITASLASLCPHDYFLVSNREYSHQRMSCASQIMVRKRSWSVKVS